MLEIQLTTVFKRILLCRKYIYITVIPLILYPLLNVEPTRAFQCAYTLLLMALYWVTEALPLPVTALLPVVFLPFFGILTTKQACNAFMEEAIMFAVGSMIVALAVESSNLHRRLALKALMVVGTKPVWLMLGFMIITAFLSMWMSNTTTVTIMIPIVDAVISEMFVNEVHSSSDSLAVYTIDKETCLPIEENPEKDVNQTSVSENPGKEPPANRIKKLLLLAICFASNVGGTATLTGTGSNLLFKGLLQSLYPQARGVSFASWMMFNFPGALLNLVLVWIFFITVCLHVCCSSSKSATTDKTNAIREKYKELGSMTFHEAAVLCIFTLLIFLWIFREPEFIDGWETPLKRNLGDAPITMAVVALLFIVPAKPWDLATSPALVEWKTLEKKIPWGTLLLMGGGLSLAEGFKKSGLSSYIGDQVDHIGHINSFGLTVMFSAMALLVTEVASNVTAVTIFLPVVAHSASNLKINPLRFMLPVTLCCSYAFLFPVATPANALVYEYGNMSIKDMFLPGLGVKVICFLGMLLMVNTYGVWSFDLDKFPDWAFTNITENASP